MSPLSAFSAEEKHVLFSDIYYLNIKELRAFCDSHRIPYSIYFEAEDGQVKKSRDQDRKAIVLDRILHYIKTGVVKPKTVFKKSVVFSNLSHHRLEARDKVLYGQYKNGDGRILKLMKQLTGGEFEFGAIAQEVLRDLWICGNPPTYEKFAKEWIRATTKHHKPNPEWAFLTDLAAGTAGPNWKLMRKRKAEAVITLMNKIV